MDAFINLFGNVLSLQDYWNNNGGPQTHNFAYDALYRLTSAQAAGGLFGNYPQESYGYDAISGNLGVKAGVVYTYTDTSHVHAVTSLSNGNTYQYDANGNMSSRQVGGQTYSLTHDAENRLVQVSGAATASFVYDGDGKRILAIEGGTTTVFIGNYFEWSGTAANTVLYYYAGTTRLAMRRGSGNVTWLLGDHLGSTSVSYDGTNELHQGYKPWGETRFGDVQTAYQFTGQYRQASLGLDFFNARWYDSYLNRWTSPDSITPDPYNPKDWDRYGYCRNNPLRYIDPTGHYTEDEIFSILGVKKWDEVYALFDEGGRYEGMWGILDILRMANDGDRFLDSYSQFNSDVVGEFRLIDGQLYLEKNEDQTLALPILSSGEYDHTALERYIPLLGVWRRTATYINSNSTHSTWRAEFDPAQVDWPAAGLDAAGIVADLFSLGVGGRFTNSAQIAGKVAGKIIGPVDLAYGIVQGVREPSLVSGLGIASDVGGLYMPIVPDVIGLLVNFGNATHFYP